MCAHSPRHQRNHQSNSKILCISWLWFNLRWDRKTIPIIFGISMVGARRYQCMLCLPQTILAHTNSIHLIVFSTRECPRGRNEDTLRSTLSHWWKHFCDDERMNYNCTQGNSIIRKVRLTFFLFRWAPTSWRRNNGSPEWKPTIMINGMVSFYCMLLPLYDVWLRGGERVTWQINDNIIHRSTDLFSIMFMWLGKSQE